MKPEGYSQRVTDAASEAFEPEFHGSVPPTAQICRLWSEGGWTEGPTWLPASQEVVFSDIPNDRQMVHSAVTGETRQFRGGLGHHVNGTTLDGSGRMLLCEHGGRALTCIDHDGNRQVLADHYRGGRLNSPNDVTVHPSGSIWFTDPSYGLEVPGQGTSEQSGNHVYRLSEVGGLEAVLTDFAYPNGIAFSADGRLLYVADSGGSRSPRGEHHIRRFNVDAEERVTGGEVFAECPNGVFDGIKVDSRGCVWASARDGVYVISPKGVFLGRVAIPECVSNLCFGGQAEDLLYVTASTSLYLVDLRK